MNLQRWAAFSNGDLGGNPAGVVIDSALPDAAEMQRLAAAVGYSETAFASRQDGRWRVRYFSPEAEVPFCGHATIALGAALAQREGAGRFELQLNDARISVEGRPAGALFSATLQSPPTRSQAAAAGQVAAALRLFGLTPADLDERIPPALAHAGADHLVLMLKHRSTLAAMQYDFAQGRTLMREAGWVTVLLGHAHAPQLFSTRNAFAYGGVVEDPATGAATAALAACLRDIGWPHGNQIEVHQGDDMGMPSRLCAQLSDEPGSAIRVSGTVRAI
jgi:PhzF family phenazine biosynthesis protein